MQVTAANFRAAMEGLDRVRQAQGRAARRAQPAAPAGRDLLAELIRAKQAGGAKAAASLASVRAPAAPAVAAGSAPLAAAAAVNGSRPAPLAPGRTLGNHVDVMA